MKPKIRHSLKICFTIVGTNIGAGFASGREIWEFFGSYGTGSTFYLVVSIALFSICSMIILWISWRQKTDHYFGILKLIMGKRMANWFDGLILLYLILSTLVMFAGSGATFSQWNMSYLFGSSVLAIAVWLILFYDVKGLMSLNYILMPSLTVILCIVCVSFLLYGEPQPVPVQTEMEWLPVWPSAVTYAALNVIPLMAVLATLGRQIRHPLEIGIAGVGSGICLGGVGVLFNLSLLRIENMIPQYDIPLFALIHSFSPVWFAVISIILWLAIYTTAVSGMYGAVFRISSWISVPKWSIALMMTVFMVPLSQFGFANLVKVIYPIYGILNLFILSMILLYPLQKQSQSA